MSESKFEGNQPPEIPTQKEIFEHLFPGNRYEQLPKFDARNLDTTLEIMSGYISGFRSGRDSVSIIRAAEENGTFVLRQEFAHPDRITASYHLTGLFPFGEVSHPTMFQGNSFSDLVDTKKRRKVGWGRAKINKMACYRFI